MQHVKHKSTEQIIHQAVQLLKAGKLVAFPTETVYGLGAHARNLDAILAVFAAKGRPSNHPLIVHIPSIEHLTQWASNIPPLAWQLAERFWPGPLTMILPKHPNVSNLITAGQDSIAIRIPNHPLTLALLAELNDAIVGPSANLFGKTSPTRAEHVIADLSDKLDLVLDGGNCSVGLESTIVSLLDPIYPKVLRAGQIPASVIANNCAYFENDKNIRRSGSLDSHYAPNKPLYLVETSKIQMLSACQVVSGVLSWQNPPPNMPADWLWIKGHLDPNKYAQELYNTIRTLDNSMAQQIIIEAPPVEEAWRAINDRLKRAATN